MTALWIWADDGPDGRTPLWPWNEDWQLRMLNWQERSGMSMDTFLALVLSIATHPRKVQ